MESPGRGTVSKTHRRTPLGPSQGPSWHDRGRQADARHPPGSRTFATQKTLLVHEGKRPRGPWTSKRSEPHWATGNDRDKRQESSRWHSRGSRCPGTAGPRHRRSRLHLCGVLEMTEVRKRKTDSAGQGFHEGGAEGTWCHCRRAAGEAVGTDTRVGILLRRAWVTRGDRWGPGRETCGSVTPRGCLRV